MYMGNMALVVKHDRADCIHVQASLDKIEYKTPA